ncbi:hypothetical protein QAD02_017535 [Eretmocerus hayati]|uniref:Uncharacterized protein n=1 Tax=Eretmocerus hayati TaxID=131215 RepID=A0ACC2PE55_9HYME|nr:hypothetical protein QAD02_017535 [Eretmocerus hayati]
MLQSYRRQINYKSRKFDFKSSWIDLSEALASKHCGLLAALLLVVIQELRAQLFTRLIPVENSVFFEMLAMLLRIPKKAGKITNSSGSHKIAKKEYMATAWLVCVFAYWFKFATSRNLALCFSKHRLEELQDIVNFLKQVMDLVSKLKFGPQDLAVAL